MRVGWDKMRLRYYLGFVRRRYVIALRWLLTYKINLVLFFATFFLDTILIIIFWKILFQNSSSLNGWTFQDAFGLVLFLYLFWTFINVFESGNRRSFREVISGKFDYFLVYPINVLVNMFFYKVTLTSILANLAILLVLLLYYILNFQYSIMNMLLAFIIAILGNVILILFMFILRCFVFWIKNDSFIANIELILNRFNRYPLNISNKVLQYIFIFLFPVMFMVTYPAEILRGNFNWSWILEELFMMVVLFIIAKVVWKKGLARYESGMG